MQSFSFPIYGHTISGPPKMCKSALFIMIYRTGWCIHTHICDYCLQKVSNAAALLPFRLLLFSVGTKRQLKSHNLNFLWKIQMTSNWKVEDDRRQKCQCGEERIGVVTRLTAAASLTLFPRTHFAHALNTQTRVRASRLFVSEPVVASDSRAETSSSGSRRSPRGRARKAALRWVEHCNFIKPFKRVISPGSTAVPC